MQIKLATACVSRWNSLLAASPIDFRHKHEEQRTYEEQSSIIRNHFVLFANSNVNYVNRERNTRTFTIQYTI